MMKCALSVIQRLARSAGPLAAAAEPRRDLQAMDQRAAILDRQERNKNDGDARIWLNLQR